MCGRYRLARPQRFAELNDVRIVTTCLPRWNIAPTQKVAVVLNESPDTLSEVRWGLIPSWAKDRKIASRLTNARAETVATQPAFRSAFKSRRCLIAADGFYEWKKSGATKIPHHILMQDGEPFAFAGLWESWLESSSEEPLRTCTVITCEPNSLVAPLHNRMPVILPRERYADWLSDATSPEDRAAMLRPYPADRMRAYPISTRVNSPRNEGASLIEEAR